MTLTRLFGLLGFSCGLEWSDWNSEYTPQPKPQRAPPATGDTP